MPSPPPWATSVVYQIYPRSFADSDGDGIGDLGGIIDHLDYLSRLGIDVVWLSPVYQSPQDDNGYDISDYQSVDPVFGTLETLDRLITAAHEREIRIMMDLVVNHTSDEHPWFAASRSGPDHAKRDWYVWRSARPGTVGGQPGAEPNNWGSFFSGPAWEFDTASGEYYLHLFSRKQPDLNWENPSVREAVFAMMRWWLDRGVDGFRMDVINMIAKEPGLPDGPPGDTGFANPLPHLTWAPQVHDYLREMNRDVFEGREPAILTVGEMPGVTVDEARLFTDPARHELNMVFQFEHVGLDQGASKWDVVPLALPSLKASLNRWQRGLATAGWNSLYWNNHDQPRAVSRFGDDGEHRVASAKTLATVLHLHRGTPYVYQGEELGMTNAPFAAVEDFADIESLNFAAAAALLGQPLDETLDALRTMGRDNARTPMQWDASDHGGFTRGTPWLAVNPNYVEVNAQAAEADPDSVFDHYRRLIALRKSEPTVAGGDFEPLLEDHPQLYAFVRRLGPVGLLMLANISATPIDVPTALEEWLETDLVIDSLPRSADRQTPTRLAAWESRVYRRLEVASG